MNRRDAVLALAGLGARSFSAIAQQAGKVWRIGVIAHSARPVFLNSGNYGLFLQGPRDLGYVDGKSVAIDWRIADGTDR